MHNTAVSTFLQNSNEFGLDFKSLHTNPVIRCGALPCSPLTSFVGREREIAEVKGLLATTRLLTLTGTGGCGKTRLALQVATDLMKECEQSVCWVELSALTDPALVTQAIASALGIYEQMDQLLVNTLTELLCSQKLLLVLDNCEHVVAACAQLAEGLLSTCPGLQILTSSREALRIAGETAWLVPSLRLPDLHHLPPLEKLMQYESVQLFVERAAAMQPSFMLTKENALAIVQVCHRLDGIPLAIELAAARVKVLSVEQIAARLNDCCRLLTSGNRTALLRQQTLRATIDWSYGLLSKEERTLFHRLSVFTGSFTLEGIEAVCTGAGIEEHEVLDLLSYLIDKSLVMVEERGGEARYRLLEAIRQYSQERASEWEETENVRRRYQDWSLALADSTQLNTAVAGEPTQRQTMALALAPTNVLAEPPTPPEEPVTANTVIEPTTPPEELATANVEAEPPTPPEATHPPTLETTPAKVKPELRIFALGSTRVYRGKHALSPTDWTYAKARELLFYLLSHQAKTKEQIGLALWPDASPTQLRSNFHSTLHHLRRALGRPEWIVFENDLYAFNRSLDYWFDVGAFESHVAQARKLQAQAPIQALHHLEKAVKLYQGDFLRDMLDSDWYLLRQKELRKIYLDALLTLGQLFFAEGQYESAANTYRQLIADDSYLEAAHRELMRCYARQGEQGQALRHYQTLVTMMRDELGSPPASETTTLFERLRRGEDV